MARWWATQYNDVKGNAKWALLAGPLWTAVSWAGVKLLRMIPHMPVLLVYVIVLVISFALFIWLIRQMRSGQRQPPTKSQIAANTSALSTSAAQFNPQQFFAISYISPLTDEAENNMRSVALTHYPSPQQREVFLLKFIGIGIQAYIYDNIWWVIYRSQLLLLHELNQKVLQLEEARRFYDAAAADYPSEYAKDSFDRWLGWLRGQNQLLIVQDGMNLAISPRGRDFLKYLVHTGRSEGLKKL